MSMSPANQITQLEMDFQQNQKQFKDLDHLGPIWKELSDLKTTDSAHFQQDLVKINSDLHKQGLLPEMQIVDSGESTENPQGFDVLNSKQLATTIKEAAKNPNGDMTDTWKQLAELQNSESPDDFSKFLNDLNKELEATKMHIVQLAPGKFAWQPIPDTTPPLTPPSQDSSSGDSNGPKPWIDPNGSSEAGSGGDGSGGGGGGGGGGYGGDGGGGGGSGSGSSSGGGGDSSASTPDATDYKGTLGDNTGDATTEQVVQAAESQIGVPYVFAGATPGKSFDCSGLTMWAWKQAGVDLPHNADAQYHDTAHVEHVPLSQLKPGDLLFYNDGGSIHHVTMYVGNGKMIEAPHTGANVREVPVRTAGLMPMAGRPHK